MLRHFFAIPFMAGSFACIAMYLFGATLTQAKLDSASPSGVIVTVYDFNNNNKVTKHEVLATSLFLAMVSSGLFTLSMQMLLDTKE